MPTNPFRKIDNERYSALINDRRLSLVKYEFGWRVQESTVNGPVTLVSCKWLGEARREAMAIANGKVVES